MAQKRCNKTISKIWVENDSVLIYNSGTHSSILPKVGDILASRITDKLPCGLGNKVREVKKYSDGIYVTTQTAPLTEIFETLHLKGEITCSEDQNDNGSSTTRATTADTKEQEIVSIPVEIIFFQKLIKKKQK